MRPVVRSIEQAASLARPGGNITGVTSQAADLSAKRLELLKQLLPQLHRVAILFEPNAGNARGTMLQTGVIRYRRGHIEILDRESRSSFM